MEWLNNSVTTNSYGNCEYFDINCFDACNHNPDNFCLLRVCDRGACSANTCVFYGSSH